MIAQSAGRFASLRERLFQFVDRVADAALTSADLEVFLPNLLRVALEGTGMAHTAAVLLREENRLRLRAAVGLEDDLAGGFSRLAKGSPVEWPSRNNLCWCATRPRTRTC